VFTAPTISQYLISHCKSTFQPYCWRHILVSFRKV